jgi:uncharacterized membrane protein
MAGEMNGQVFQPSNSKLGNMDAKWMILIAYFGSVVLGFIPGASYVAWLVPLIVFFIDKENKFIAFHAMQSFLLGVVAAVIYIIMGIIVLASTAGAVAGAVTLNPYAFGAGLGVILVTGAVAVVVAIIVLIFAILACVKGFKYEIYEIPLVGKWSEKIVFKTK